MRQDKPYLAKLGHSEPTHFQEENNILRGAKISKIFEKFICVFSGIYYGMSLLS